MKLLITKEGSWFKKWDEFILSDRTGSFLELSVRMRSYNTYGVECELMLWVDESGHILMGSLNALTSFSLFKVYTCSYASCVTSGNHKLFLTEFEQRAIELGAFVSQVSLPCENSETSYLKGKVFNKLPFLEMENKIFLTGDEGIRFSSDEVMARFSKKARRDVRLSYRKELYSKVSSTETEYKMAYSCIENNAKTKGYSVRSWEEFGSSLSDMLNNGTAFLITAWYGTEIQGSILVEKSANSLNYTMGGVFRHTPDLHTGYFLQMEAIKLAINLECDYYNISYGGPCEVIKFKNSFNPVLFESGHLYYQVHRSLLFKVYNYIFNVDKNKSKPVTLLLSFISWLRK